MKLAELKKQLGRHPDANFRFLLPDGNAILPNAHVTEVARIDRQFVDCGGTLRNDSLCRLQTWIADDVDHRLTAGKLLKILDKAKSFLVSDDLEVDVEHEIKFVSQFSLESVEVLRFAIRRFRRFLAFGFHRRTAVRRYDRFLCHARRLRREERLLNKKPSRCSRPACGPEASPRRRSASRNRTLLLLPSNAR